MKIWVVTWVACASLLCASVVRGEPASGFQYIEQTGWFDPDSALTQLDAVRPARDGHALVEWLTLRGFALVDTNQAQSAGEIVTELRTLAQRGILRAGVSARFVQAVLSLQNDRFIEARAELDAVEPKSVETLLDQYRLDYLYGCALRFLGEHELALSAFERANDTARKMRSAPHAVHALLTSSQFFIRTGNLDRAAAQLQEARRWAEGAGDDASLVIISNHEGDIAGRRGDRTEERRASLESLARAHRVGSARLLGTSYANLADSYLKANDFVTSHQYSRLALALAPKFRQNGFEQTVRFNLGLAEIGLGRLKAGIGRVETEIDKSLQAGNIVDAEDMMREYSLALEGGRQWRKALEVHRRGDALRDQLINTSRQRALLELSARFDAERKARAMELLARENAVKSAQLRAQRLSQQLALTAAIGAAALSLVLIWAFLRVRKANKWLSYQSTHDALTGLANRNYFNEHISGRRGKQQFEGGVLIIDVDHFKRINDAYGHSAGDHVLREIGQRLARALRENDTLLRWGGEEFLAVLRPMSESQLAATARRMLDTVRETPLFWHGDTLHCTISIGYASFPLAGAATEISLNQAISLVDKALYAAKQRGRDRACLISVLHASSEEELTAISGAFDAATADRRVQLQEMVSSQAA